MSDPDRKRQVSVEDAPAPSGAYSQAIRANGLIFVAGQVGFEPGSSEPVSDSVAEQTRCALRNVEAVLAGAGATLADVVKTTVYLSDMNNFAEFDRAYSELVPDPKPARATVGAGLPGFAVEIEAIAVEPAAS